MTGKEEGKIDIEAPYLILTFGYMNLFAIITINLKMLNQMAAKYNGSMI
jgi:hypothetical protein